MVYKHVIGLKTDVFQSNLGGNTDSNHLIPGVVGHFPSVSLRRRPVQLVILISFFFSPASDAGFLCFVRGSLAPRLFFVLCPSLYLGPCFYSAGCYPAFSYVFSPASDAGVLPPLWRGKVLPFTVQSRDHLATITDIYVPSFLRPVRGSLAPRLLSSIPPDDKLLHGTKNHTLRQIFIFHFINLSMLFFDYFYFVSSWYI